jgi:hypothetical protein
MVMVIQWYVVITLVIIVTCIVIMIIHTYKYSLSRSTNIEPNAATSLALSLSLSLSLSFSLFVHSIYSGIYMQFNFHGFNKLLAGSLAKQAMYMACMHTQTCIPCVGIASLYHAMPCCDENAQHTIPLPCRDCKGYAMPCRDCMLGSKLPYKQSSVPFHTYIHGC